MIVAYAHGTDVAVAVLLLLIAVALAVLFPPRRTRADVVKLDELPPRTAEPRSNVGPLYRPDDDLA